VPIEIMLCFFVSWIRLLEPTQKQLCAAGNLHSAFCILNSALPKQAPQATDILHYAL
jgi:hypothetical protein